MRRQRVLITVAAVLVGIVVLHDTAGADCAGPTLTHKSGEFARHATLTVTGQFFGDNCYDAGPAPESEGVLGRPLTGLEVLFVQGDNQWVVATGNADESYGFEAVITVPADTEIGDATIAVRWPGSGGELFSIDGPIVVLDSDTDDLEIPPATFGPAASAAPVEVAAETDDAERATWIAVGMVIAAAAIGGLLLLSQRSSY